MAEQLFQLDSRSTAVRILMIVVLLLALAWSWFIVRWYIGNTLAEYFDPDQSGLPTAKLAASFASDDPLVHWRIGELTQKKLPLDQMPQAISEYENAVRLAPNDYRFWMSLGTALEQIGENQQAELALRRSVELAPSYSYPAWFLGNLLLREGRYPEAFAELRRASESDPELRTQLFNLVWEVYSKDSDSLRSAIGDSSESRAKFSQYLMERNRFEDGIRMWDSLSESEKKANRETGRSIIGTLLAGKAFHEALSIWNELSPSLTYHAEVGKLVDGGFEADPPRTPEMGFDWKVKAAPQMQIGFDRNNAHQGNRSLHLTFSVQSRIEGMNVSQLVAILPGVEYNLSYYLKTQNLQTAATPVVEVVDAADGLLLAHSNPAPTGTQEWQASSLTFKTGQKSQAVIVRLGRASCGDNQVCPIFGSLWYDDFNLSR